MESGSSCSRVHHGKSPGLGEGAAGLALIGGTSETFTLRTPRREGGRSPPRESSDERTQGAMGAGGGGKGEGAGEGAEGPGLQDRQPSLGAPRGLEAPPPWAHEDACSEFVRHEESGDATPPAWEWPG